MKFTIDEFEVTVLAGKPEVVYHNDGNGNYREVTITAPEELIHPAFKVEFEEYTKRCIKLHQNKVRLHGGFCDTMRYVPPRKIKSKFSAHKFRKQIETRVGDIEEAKDTWDYNRAPAGVVKTGKFGDLKAFLEMRTGREINCMGQGRGKHVKTS